MANLDSYKLSLAQRRRRHFSENFKQKKVQEIELGQIRVSEICKQYEVNAANVYKWISKFGVMKKEKTERIIVETNSDTQQLLELKKKVAELERIIGQKQLLLDFKDKMIDLAEQTYAIDIKKKFSTQPSSTTGSIDKKTNLD